jgi:squalene-associated FAD-dependent desaturase
MKVAVVGAGWAGLASAVALQKTGFIQVVVFEAAGSPGGRARRVEDTDMGILDNGQHLLLGSYTSCLSLISELQPSRNPETLYVREPLKLESADGSFHLSTVNAKGLRQSLLKTLLHSKGLGLYDKWRALCMMRALKARNWQDARAETVTQLLAKHKQTSALLRRLWVPLCLAALNTAPEQACAQLFQNVLRDSLGGSPEQSDTIIPKVDLSALWPDSAAKLFEMRYRQIVRKIVIEETHVSIDGETFDACISALPPYALARTLTSTQQQNALASLQQQLNAFEHNAITTLTLKLAKPWRLPSTMLMLDEDHTKASIGQWVFNRPNYADQLAVVISVSEDYLKSSREKLVDGVSKQIREQVAKHPMAKEPMPEVIAHKLIVEKRATFAANPRLDRPTALTSWPRLFLAGDYVAGDYPAVLEAAVNSGVNAAQALINAKLAQTTSLAQ